MSAPILITRPSRFVRGPLAGLAANEVNFDPVTITGSSVAASHQSDTGSVLTAGGYEGHAPDSGYMATHAPFLSPSSPNFLGVGITAAGVLSMVAGAVAFGMGYKVLGGVLGVVGLGAAVAPAVMGKMPFSGAPILITHGQGMV